MKLACVIFRDRTDSTSLALSGAHFICRKKQFKGILDFIIKHSLVFAAISSRNDLPYILYQLDYDLAYLYYPNTGAEDIYPNDWGAVCGKHPCLGALEYEEDFKKICTELRHYLMNKFKHIKGLTGVRIYERKKW